MRVARLPAMACFCATIIFLTQKQLRRGITYDIHFNFIVNSIDYQYDFNTRADFHRPFVAVQVAGKQSFTLIHLVSQ